MYCRMGKIESEEHFLFECPNYTKDREEFRTQLILHDQKFNRMGEKYIPQSFPDRCKFWIKYKLQTVQQRWAGQQMRGWATYGAGLGF